jgi:hypothetical protein
VTSEESGKSYHLTLRGEGRGESSCSCPDFRCNTLGTCKHIMHAIEKVKRGSRSAERRRPYKVEQLLLHLQYGDEVSLRWNVPAGLPDEAAKIVRRWKTARSPTARSDAADPQAAAIGQNVTITPDAEEYIQQACSSSGSATAWPRSAAIRPASAAEDAAEDRTAAVPVGRHRVRRRRGRAVWPTTWGWARRSRASAWPSCWRAKPTSGAC